MTAGEIAAATGLGRATVSANLSKLATSGQVTKAAGGYQLPGRSDAPAAESTAEAGTPDGIRYRVKRPRTGSDARSMSMASFQDQIAHGSTTSRKDPGSLCRARA